MVEWRTSEVTGRAPKVEYTNEEFNWICTIIDGRKFEGNRGVSP